MTNELEQLKKARKLVSELATYGACNWMMSVPPRPEYDSDLILANALDGAIAILEQHNTKPSAVDGAVEVPQELAMKWWAEGGYHKGLRESVQAVAQLAIAWDRQNRATKPAVSDATFDELLDAVVRAAENNLTQGTALAKAMHKIRQYHVHALQSPIPDHVEDSLTMVPVSQQLTSEAPKVAHVCGIDCKWRRNDIEPACGSFKPCSLGSGAMAKVCINCGHADVCHTNPRGMSRYD